MSEFDEHGNLEDTSSDYLIEIWYSASVYGIHFGWFVLAAALLILYFWPRIQKHLDKMYIEKVKKAYEAKCKKNPDWLISRQQAMEAARIRMQEELSRKAKEHEEKMKELEEKKRLEKLASLDKEAGGQTLGSVGSNNNKKSKNNFKPDYNPLMGSGPSTTYRPPRRSCCPSGGCG
ncbi:selenoprotein S-like [Lycorma delicatula]|uniref:selenoprotein S-like n=1 Tax=Lycorma delicatula TaxID=130591 RepID=UPI003F516B8D